MKSFALVVLSCMLLLGACTRPESAQSSVDRDIAMEIEHTKSIDNHAHPVKVEANGEQDRDFDALPADAVQDPAMPTAARPDNPMFAVAWQQLFGYRLTGPVAGPQPDLIKAKAAMKQQKGDGYPVWVLDQMDTEIMLANRISMGRGLPANRFKWVPYVDMFLFPLDNSAIRQKDSEHDAFMRNEEKLLKGYLAQAKFDTLPDTFEGYLSFVGQTLEGFKSGGAVALKFELAYLRDLDISDPKKEDAEQVYKKYVKGSSPSAEDYKVVEDYVFRHIAHEAGRLGMAIHIHTSLGVGSYFRSTNANPFALEPLFNDPALRKTNFVMLHGAWPFTREAAALIVKPNVYVDYSAFSYVTYPRQAGQDLRLFLEAAPEKVLYGSDASPFSATVGWEETGWIAARFNRQALGQALTGMMNDGEISQERARELVHLVLRDNARQLYHW